MSFVNMQEVVSQSLFSYWNALRRARPAPRRFEIEPSRIASFLPDTFILERLNHGNIRFRLAGTRITDALGIDLRGKNIFELFGAKDASTLRSQMDLVTSHCGVGLFLISAETAEGVKTTFEMLILPLTHIRDSVERYLGCIAPIDKPAWLGSAALSNHALIDYRIIWPDGRSPESHELQERQTPFFPARRDARLVKSSRRQFRVYDGGLSHPLEE